MNNLFIRKATISDSSSILNFEYQDLECGYSLEQIKESLLNDNYLNYIAFLNDEPVGYLSCNCILDECELIKVIVDKKFRHKGIGGELIKCLINFANSEKMSKIFLEVRKDNINAIKLYEKFGFQKFAERKKYYNGIDAELYWLKIYD